MVKKIYDLNGKKFVTKIPTLDIEDLQVLFPGKEILLKSNGYVEIDTDEDEATIKTKIDGKIEENK